jgi:tetratricopeptide (TPR) repeat protein
MTSRRIVMLGSLLVLAAVAQPARAEGDPKAAARAHFKRAEAAFNLGKFEEALAAYQAAYETKPLPGFLFNIAQCHRNLNDYDQAIFSFKKYLKLEPEASNKESVERLIEELEEKKAQGDSQKFVKKPKKDEGSPIYKKWWFWTGLGVAAAGGTAAIYATRSGSSPPATDLGNIVFGK